MTVSRRVWLHEQLLKSILLPNNNTGGFDEYSTMNNLDNMTNTEVGNSNTINNFDIYWLEEKISQFKQNKITREVIRSVPNGILPIGTEGYLKDISINAKGADDEIYKQNEEARTYIPRGMTLLGLTKNGEDTSTDTVIYANRKFFDYSNGLKSKDEMTNLSQYLLEDVNLATRIIAVEKVNGEAAHFSGRFIDGKFYLFAGSKNVHLIFQNKQHIDLYTDSRYLIASIIAETVLEKWNELSESNRRNLEIFLHSSHTTVVCEIIMQSHQHVVHFGDVNKNRLIVLCLTPSPSLTQKSLTALPTEQCLMYFSSSGFEIPEYKCISLIDMDSHRRNIRTSANTEGVVYYYENTDGDTIGMQKFKSKWYIHLRALRQQAAYRYSTRKGSNKSIVDAKLRSQQRMQEIQGWLFTSDNELRGWEALSDQWFNWLEKQAQLKSLDRLMLKDNFPSVWKQFTENESS